MPPEVLIFWRNLFTVLSLLPAVYIFKKKFSFSWKGTGYATLGAILMTFYNFLFFWGLKLGFAGLGGVLVTTLNPLFNFLFLVILGKYSISKKETFALFLGFLGGIFTLQLWNFKMENFLLGGNGFFLLGSIVWAILTILSSNSNSSIHPMNYSFQLYAIATVLSFVPAYLANGLETKGMDFNFWMGIFYLSAISTGFATTVYFIASSQLGSHVSSSYVFLVPFSAVLTSSIVLGEIPSGYTIIGGTLAITAVQIIQYSQRRKKKFELIEPS